MKTTILTKVQNDKELSKGINKASYYDAERFVRDAERFVKATKEGRIFCIITSVSRSGMSRNLKFIECRKGKGENRHYFNNFFTFMLSLGYSPADRDSHSFRISGCGMDMVFHTHYSIIHKLGRLGIITKKEVDKLAQMTPATF